jgi:hypothetical protein
MYISLAKRGAYHGHRGVAVESAGTMCSVLQGGASNDNVVGTGTSIFRLVGVGTTAGSIDLTRIGWCAILRLLLVPAIRSSASIRKIGDERKLADFAYWL